MRPTPDRQNNVCPTGCACHAVRAPGVKVTTEPPRRDGELAVITGSWNTTPVKVSAAPRFVVRSPARMTPALTGMAFSFAKLSGDFITECSMSNSGTIRIGIGGWVYPPWRGTFYPPGLPQSQELAYASGHLTAIEINGTFYNSGRPDSFRKWRDGTPENFVFSLKGPRFVTHRTELAG